MYTTTALPISQTKTSKINSGVVIVFLIKTQKFLISTLSAQGPFLTIFSQFLTFFKNTVYLYSNGVAPLYKLAFKGVTP